MVDARILDLHALDRDVARAAAGLETWRARLRADPMVEGDDPVELVRHVAARSTRDALREMQVGVADEPLRQGLVRWVGALVAARIGLADENAWAQAAGSATVRFEGEKRQTVGWREAFRGLVAARSAPEGRRWLAAIAEAASPIAAATRVGAARRLEVAQRLGFAHPWDAEGRALLGRAADVAASARAWLDATDDLAQAERRTIAREGTDAADVFQAAMARSASDGWPARLSTQWFDDVFGKGPRGLSIRVPAWPPALGAASFVRALAELGRAVRAASIPGAIPFAVGHDPWSAGAHRLGAVFAALAADPELYVRGLHTSRRVAAAQARTLAATILVDTRLEAARVLLGDDARFAPPDVFDEVTMRVFGAPLDMRLSGAWPRVRIDEPERWTAVLEARAARAALRDRFDVDWFRNPRAWEEIRASDPPRRLAPPAENDAPAGAWKDEIMALARTFEEALG